jgi:sugar phosphate isomerase/epimerase
MVDPRFSINQKTTENMTVPEIVAACGAAGVTWIGLWREHVAAHGLDATAELLRTTDLKVSSLCRGGFFPAATQSEFLDNIEENVRALDEAQTLGTDVVVLVCGGIAGGDLGRSRDQVAEAISVLAPEAARRGTKLAIEPLHPMFGADRSVVVTLGQALTMAELHPPDHVGVVVDTYHVWWDPDIWAQIDRARGRILSYQVCDWLDPLPDPLMGRGMMGDGVIDFRRLTDAVLAAGYDGPIEVEIFNEAIWRRNGADVLAEAIERFDRLIVQAPSLGG